MRIQVMPLPTETIGAFSHTPFLIVIDGIEPNGYVYSMAEAIKQQAGAVMAIVTEGPLDVGSPLELTDEQQAGLLERISATS